MTKQFIFLYPIPEIINLEIERWAGSFTREDKEKEFLQKLSRAKSKKEEELIRQEARKELISEFKEFYKSNLNSCIDARYRKNGFGINYAVFNGSVVSDVIELGEGDRIIEVGIDFKTHTTKKANGKYPYPRSDYILNQLNGVKIIRIAGFHLWDCVEKLAKRAYKRRLDTLVDEDLTQFFAGRLKDPDFKIDKYPTYNPRKGSNPFYIKRFMKARRGKPWLWQDY